MVPLFCFVVVLLSIDLYCFCACRFTSARKMKRKIVFHSGPTNSGKTYHALKRFQDSNSGIYGGPLRMLAAEVYSRTNMNVSLIYNAIAVQAIPT